MIRACILSVLLAGCRSKEPSVVSIEPALDFGPVARGGFLSRHLTVKNEGTRPVALDGFVNLGSDTAFFADFLPFHLQPAKSYTFDVLFVGADTPLRTEHATTFALQWEDQDAEVNVTGTSVFVDCFAVQPVEFGNVPVGETVQRPLVVLNTAAITNTVDVGPLSVLQGDAFGFEGAGSYALQSGEPRELPITFHASRPATSVSLVTVHQRDLCPPVDVVVHGMSLATTMTCSPEVLDFDANVVGSPTRKSIIVANVGFAPLHLRLPAGGEFAFDVDAGTVVPGARTITVPLIFTPAQPGARSAFLTAPDAGATHCELRGTGAP